MCGEDSRDIAGLPIDLIQQVIEPTEAQRAALDELANASVTAAQIIRAACPTQISLTAPSRLTAMQQRLEAMVAAVAAVRPAMDRLYGLLNDEQKARLNALADNQQKKTVTRQQALCAELRRSPVLVIENGRQRKPRQGCARPEAATQRTRRPEGRE